ncbi:MAG: methyl-accepting chemotaxis protein [Rhodospirillaceae bacterium]|nr:MAG: methyl-accepting chemotaxis protein [Rhodospirillaceae bacterium]
MGHLPDQGMRDTGLATRIDGATSALFSDCLDAFHAFVDLDQLAEDLRILSLNAEPAAGRAGDRGRAVRALTQYTRALVSRLSSVQGDILHIRSDTYINSARALNELSSLRQFERAVLAC